MQGKQNKAQITNGCDSSRAVFAEFGQRCNQLSQKQFMDQGDGCSSMQGKQNRAQFTNWLCYELSGVCRSKPPPLPKSRKPGPAFEPMDAQEAQMEKMLAGMKVSVEVPTEPIHY